MATINLTSSSLVASFPGLNRANGSDQLELTATLFDLSGAPLEGATVAFMASPVFRADVVGATTETFAGVYETTFSSKDASIKNISVLVDGVEVGLTAQVEMVESDDSFLVDDPFTDNVGQLTGDLTISGQQITLRAESNNSGAITEIIWNGQQLLNVLNKDRALQTKVVKDNFGQTNWAQLNEAGAFRQAWADPSSSRYIGDVQDLRHLVTQTFMSYRDPINYNGLPLDCSGDILTKHIGMDYLGNPNIFRVDFQNDQYASNKVGATSWAVSLGLTQEFTRFYTFAPASMSDAAEAAQGSGTDVINSTYMGGPIASNADGTLAIGIFRDLRSPDAELLSSYVRPQQVVAGAPKFTENYGQLIDFEDSAASGGMSAGRQRMERFICVGTMQAVTNAFRELYYFQTTGVQNPGDPGDPPPPPAQKVDRIEVTSGPSGVTRGSVFSVGIRAVDFLGQTVTDYNGTVILEAAANLGLSTPTTVKSFLNGETTFTDLALTGSGIGNLSFTTQTPEGPRNGTWNIGIENEVPTINAITPNTATDSVPAVEIRVDGTGLIENVSSVRWGGTTLSTTFNAGGGGSDFLTATVPGSLLLESPTPYNVSVFNIAPGGGQSNSLPFQVTDGTAPTVLNSSVSSQGRDATISWQTNEASITSLVYGPTGSSATDTITLTDPVTNDLLFSTQHQIQLANLASETAYTATVITEDPSGNRNSSAATVTWITDDVVAPTIDDIAVNVLGANNATITVTASEPCNIALTLKVNGQVFYNAPTQGAAQGVAVFQLSGLPAATLFTYEIIATDFAGNSSDMSSGSFSTEAAPDTTPPAFLQQPTITVNGLGAQASWQMDEQCSGRVLYRERGSQAGYTTAIDPATSEVHVVNLLLPFFEREYEYYVEGEDAANNYYSSDTFFFATGPDPTGPGGGLDPSAGDLVVGDVLTALEINVPEGVGAGDTFVAHATVPISRPSDLLVNWEVNGVPVQRHINSYKPRAQQSASRFAHQLVAGQITFPATQWQASAGALPTGWETTPQLTWTGGNLADPTTVDPVRFFSDLTPGVYELKLKGDAAYTQDEYFHVRINKGAWLEAYGTSGDFGGYTDNTETSYHTFTVGPDEVGEYLLEIAGATDTISLDRIAIVPAGEAPSLTNASPITITANDPTGANSVEVVFPVTVPANVLTVDDPQSPTQLTRLYHNLVASNRTLPGTTASAGRETDDLKLVMDMPAPGVAVGGDPEMAAFIAAGAGQLIKSGPYMEEFVYYTRLVDASSNAGVGCHTYVRYYRADLDNSVYVDLNITNSHVDTTRIVSGMSENAYVGNPGKIFFDRLYVTSASQNYDIINGFGAETVTTPSGDAMTVGDPYCGGPALGDDSTFFFVDYTDNPSTDLTRSHDGTGGIPARSEVFHAGAQRIEQIVLRPASPNKPALYATGVSQYQNVGRTILSQANRNASQQLRWYGGNYYRGGDLPETYVAQSPFPATLTGSLAYDRMRMNNAALAIKEVLSTGAIQANRDFFEQGGIIDWADQTQFGCWTPGGSVDGSSSKNHMLNVYETAGGPGHTRGWAFFARTVLQRHSITAFDANGAPITIRHLYGTSAQAGATANESAVQVRNDRSGQAHGWSFFYERDEWVADRFYSRGTQVRYNGQDFVCITSHRAAAAPSIGATWAAGSENNTRANQREFNGTYPIVPASDIDSGSAYTAQTSISCAYDTAWDQFTPISRDYIQRLYRCFMGLRLSVNPGIFNDYQRYQTELYLAAEDRFITQDVLNGGKTNDTLGHCLEAFTGSNANRGFFHNDDFSDPGMQSDWGAGKAWAHWVIAQGLFFTAPEEVYPAPVLGGEAYNRRQHIKEHVSDVRQLIANVMPGEASGNITETYPVSAASRRSYLNSRDDIPGFEDANVVGYVVNFPTSNPFTLETLQGLLDDREYGEVEVRMYNTGDLKGYMVAATAATGSPATLWVKQTVPDIAFFQGNVMKLTDNQGNQIPQAQGHLLQTAGLEIDGREFSHAKTDELHINTHLWQCLAEATNASSNDDAKDLFRLSVDHAQFDLQNTGTPQNRLNWNLAAEVSAAATGLYSDWSGRVAGTSTTFAGGVYPDPEILVPTALNPTNLGIDSSVVPRNTPQPSDKRLARDGQPINRLPAVTGAFRSKVSSDWANLAWIAAHYSTRRLGTTDPEGLLSPYLLNSYLRTGLGYEVEADSPFLTYDQNGNILDTDVPAQQRALINSFNDTEERYGAKNRILAGNYAKDISYENWYNSAPIMAEVDYALRAGGVPAAGIRFLYSADVSGDNRTALDLEFTPGVNTINQSVTLANNGIPTSSNTNVTLSLEPDPEGPAGGFPGSTRIELNTTSFVIPANTGVFSAPIQLSINRNAVNDFYSDPIQGAKVVATATGAIQESISMPITLSYPSLDPSIVRFPSSGAAIQDGQTVQVNVTRATAQQLINITVLSSATDGGFTVTGLSGNKLTMSTGVTQASFTVTYNQPAGAPPGAMTFTLDEDEGEPYTVAPGFGQFTLTALIPLEGGDSEIAVSRIGAGDALGGPTPGTVGLSTGDLTLVNVMVPVSPSQAQAPQYAMAVNNGGAYLADSFAAGRDADGINLVQVTCPVTADVAGQLRHSIPGDQANPAIQLARLGVGDPIPPLAPVSVNTMDLTGVLVKLLDSDGTTYTFDPDSASQRIIYIGNYTRQVEYYGQMTDGSDTMMVVRMIVTERADLEVATVDIVVENSAVDCPATITTAQADAPNTNADGIVYFTHIELEGGNYSVGEGASHPSQGESGGSFYLVKPYTDMHSTGSYHGILPGQWFVRRVALFNPSVNSNLVSDIVNREDWGFVEGGLGYTTGGFGASGEGLPMYSRIAGLDFAGETGFRAAKARADQDVTDAVTDFQTGTLPATTALGGGSTQWTSWGWFKGTGDASTLKNPAAVKPFGVNVPSWRPGLGLVTLVDRTIERSGFAVFNTATGYPLRDSEYRTGGQTPAAFNLFRNPALDVNPWMWTNTAVPGNSTSTNWARAAASKQTNQGCPYLDTDDMVNWHRNVVSLTDPTDASQTDRDPSYGPFRGSANSRTLQAYVPAIYLLNDRVAKILCEYDATRAMFGFSRYGHKGGGQQSSRSPYGAAQATFGLYFLAEEADSPYLDPSNTQGVTNTGIVLKRQSDGSGGFNTRISEIPGVESWAGPALAVSTAYHVGDSSTRNWVAPATDRNWFTLMQTVLTKIVSNNGIVGASVANAVEAGIPRYTGESNVTARTGPLPGPQAGNGSISDVTAPTNLDSQTVIFQQVDLVWDYPISGYPEPDNFEILRDGIVVFTETDGTVRSFTETGLDASQTYTYNVRVNYGSSSATSAPLTGVLADGSDSTAGQPTYDGEEDLPLGYWVPQTTFNYLIDVNTLSPTPTENAIKTAQLEFTRRTEQVPAGSPDYMELEPRASATPTRIAVLLPARNETNEVSVSRTGDAAIKAQFDLGTRNVEIHFVAPWVASAENRIQAAEEARADALTHSYVYDVTPSGTNDIEIDGTYEVAHVQYHLWNWDIRLTNPMKLGRTVASTTAIDRVYQEQDVFLHMCKVSGSAGLDVELTRLQLEGVYFDLPTSTGSAITMDAIPYGNMNWQYVDAYNVGKSFAQVRNSNSIDAEAGLRERIQSGSAGRIKVTESYFDNYLTQDSTYAVFSWEGAHHAVEFGDNAEFYLTTGTGTAPILRVFNDDTADTTLGLSNSRGEYCTGVTISAFSAGFFSNDPTDAVIKVDAAEVIKLSGRISVGTGATNNTVEIGTEGRGALGASGLIFRTLEFNDVNTNGNITNWLASLPNSPSGILPEGEGGTNATDLGELSANDSVYNNFQGATNGEWNEPGSDPFVPSTDVINALSMVDQDVAINKITRQFSRQPRTEANYGGTVNFWARTRNTTSSYRMNPPTGTYPDGTIDTFRIGSQTFAQLSSPTGATKGNVSYTGDGTGGPNDGVITFSNMVRTKSITTDGLGSLWEFNLGNGSSYTNTSLQGPWFKPWTGTSSTFGLYYSRVADISNTSEQGPRPGQGHIRLLNCGMDLGRGSRPLEIDNRTSENYQGTLQTAFSATAGSAETGPDAPISITFSGVGGSFLSSYGGYLALQDSASGKWEIISYSGKNSNTEATGVRRITNRETFDVELTPGVMTSTDYNTFHEAPNYVSPIYGAARTFGHHAGNDPFNYGTGNNVGAQFVTQKSVDSLGTATAVLGADVNGNLVSEPETRSWPVGTIVKKVNHRSNYTKWGMRQYNTPRMTVEDCDWFGIRIEHAIYISNLHASFTARRCRIEKCAGQGFQFQHRDHGYQGYPNADGAPFQETPAHLIEDCHFIDNEYPWREDGGRAATSLQFQDPGCSEFGGSINLKDCSFIALHQGVPFNRLHRASGVPEWAKALTYSTMQQSGPAYGPQFADPSIRGLDNGPTNTIVPAAAANWGTGSRIFTMLDNYTAENCIYHRGRAGRAAIKIASTHTLKWKDCAFREDVPRESGYSRVAFLNIDGANGYLDYSGAYSSYLIFENCVAKRTRQPLAELGRAIYEGSGIPFGQDDPVTGEPATDPSDLEYYGLGMDISRPRLEVFGPAKWRQNGIDFYDPSADTYLDITGPDKFWIENRKYSTGPLPSADVADETDPNQVRLEQLVDMSSFANSGRLIWGHNDVNNSGFEVIKYAKVSATNGNNPFGQDYYRITSRDEYSSPRLSFAAGVQVVQYTGAAPVEVDRTLVDNVEDALAPTTVPNSWWTPDAEGKGINDAPHCPGQRVTINLRTGVIIRENL